MDLKGSNIFPVFDGMVTRTSKENLLKQMGGVFWLTGFSGSGKSTLAKAVEAKLSEQGFLTQLLDGDNVRTGLCNNLGFSKEDRVENIRRVSEVAKLFKDAGIICICSFISPTESIRLMAKEIVGEDDFHEVYVKCSLEVCEDRDVKGLYKKARAGEISDFTGIDAPYESPKSPELVVDTGEETLNHSVSMLLNYIKTTQPQKK